MKRNLILLVILSFALAPLAFGQGAPLTPAEARIAKEVRHELLMLPWFGVFDNIAFQVNGGTVTLLGSGSPSLSIGIGGITNNSTDGPTTFDSSLGTVQVTAGEQWNNDSSQALNINSGENVRSQVGWLTKLKSP